MGYLILQLALTDQLQRPFETVVAETLLQPLGLADSPFAQELPESLAARAAHGHRASAAPVEGGWTVYPEMSAAGLWTTPGDLATLVEIANARTGRSERILSRETAVQMLAQQRDEMGLGVVIKPGDRDGYLAHSGANPGYVARFEMFAEPGRASWS